MGKRKKARNSSYTDADRLRNKEKRKLREENKYSKKINHWLNRYTLGKASRKEIDRLKELGVID